MKPPTIAKGSVLILSSILALGLAGAAIAQPADPPPDDDVVGGDVGGDNGAQGGENGGDTDKKPEAEKPAEAPADGDTIDVDALRQEYLKLRDRLFRSRARAASVASALYSTRITVYLNYGSGRYYSVNRATIRLDGANIFDDTDSSISKNKAPRFDGYVAPGRHVLSMRIEAAGKDDDRFTSIIENTYVVQAVAGKNLVVTANAKDGGDIPYKWKKKKKGSYKLHLNVDVKTEKRGKKSNERVRRK